VRLRVVVASVVAALAVVLLGAVAASAETTVVAQASPDPCATVFDRVCDPTEQRGFNEEQQPLPPGSDPPGHMIRSLVTIAFMAVLFFLYVAWALQRGTPRA
jgi:hypothetical protein